MQCEGSRCLISGCLFQFCKGYFWFDFSLIVLCFRDDIDELMFLPFLVSLIISCLNAVTKYLISDYECCASFLKLADPVLHRTNFNLSSCRLSLQLFQVKSLNLHKSIKASLVASDGGIVTLFSSYRELLDGFRRQSWNGANVEICIVASVFSDFFCKWVGLCYLLSVDFCFPLLRSKWS